jgi:hypothetical protein
LLFHLTTISECHLLLQAIKDELRSEMMAKQFSQVEKQLEKSVGHRLEKEKGREKEKEKNGKSRRDRSASASSDSSSGARGKKKKKRKEKDRRKEKRRSRDRSEEKDEEQENEEDHPPGELFDETAARAEAGVGDAGRRMDMFAEDMFADDYSSPTSVQKMTLASGSEVRSRILLLL